MSKGQPPRSHSRFIPQEEIDDSTVVQWRFGAVDAQSGGVFAPAQPAAFIPAGTEHFNGFSPSIAHQLQPPPQTQAVEPVEPASPAFDEEQLQQMLDQARAEGHAQGLAEGRTQTQQQWQQRLDDHINGAGRESVQRVDGVLQGLEDNFKQLQSGMAQELLNLASAGRTLGSNASPLPFYLPARPGADSDDVQDSLPAPLVLHALVSAGRLP